MKTILFTILLICQFSIFAQKVEVYYGVSGRNDVTNDCIELYDKGYYITGGFENGNGYYYNGWYIKTDVNLEMLYDKVVEHSSSTVATFASACDSTGNIYVTGFTTYPGQWPFVVKIDSCGQKQWCKILSYEDYFNWGSANDIIINSSNEIVLLTSLNSDDKIDKVHLIGLNGSGDVLWKKPYASRNDHPWIRQATGYNFTEINNEYFISGFCYYPYPNDTTHFFLRPFFIGIDSCFKEKWILPFAPLDSVYGDAYNTIAINDSVMMGIGERWLPGIDKNTILMFFSTEGETLGYKPIPTDSIAPNLIANVSKDIKRINDSLFITFSVWGSTPDGGICSEMIIDTSGKIYRKNESTYCIGGGSLIKTYDEKYVYAVTVEESKSDDDIYLYKIDENLESVPFDSTVHTYDSLCPGGIQSSTINITDCLIWTDIGEAPGPAQYYESLRWIPIKAYPNPVREGKVTLEFENTEHHQNMELRCYNNFGREIHRQKIYKGQQDTDVNVSAWGKGVYIAVIYSNGGAVGKVKFVVEGGRW
ncbi:MAG: hypothetical protein B6I19_09490 [Bacteroidetes bacterium 4572_114]|nr:MAG: hypothetical protein B6I19_09490 [Bacteroidetes bacterium 4572_114]